MGDFLNIAEFVHFLDNSTAVSHRFGHFYLSEQVVDGEFGILNFGLIESG